MTILPDWTFTSFEEAVAFVEDPDRYVIKPCPAAPRPKKSFPRRAEDGQDVVAMSSATKR